MVEFVRNRPLVSVEKLILAAEEVTLLPLVPTTAPVLVTTISVTFYPLTPLLPVCVFLANGQCKTDSATNVTACVCLKGFHGVDCSKQGGRSSKGVAAAISGGVIAAIVLAGVVALAVISFGAKKTYDWVGMRDSNLGAARNNPTFQNPTNETNNYLYVDSAGTSPNSSPRS